MSTNEESIEEIVLNSTGSQLFNALEKKMQAKIPALIRNILFLNDVDCAYTISRLTDISFEKMKIFMRSEFTADMILDAAPITDYLGKYTNCQQKFEFSCGQMVILQGAVECCQTLYPNQSTNDQNNKQSDDTESEEDDEFSINDGCFDPSIDEKDKVTSLRNHIGSLMINIYNDAKRSSLSAWSFPSRYVAAEMACNFKTNGNLLGNSINLQYVTPSQHPDLLKCVVHSDKPNLAVRLQNALALSLRVDGSVDRTQNHNIYVLVNAVFKDVTFITRN
jgi:hypothetical protein